MLVFRRNGLLGLHCCQLRDIDMLFNMLARRLTSRTIRGFAVRSLGALTILFESLEV
jgi:hypothetical protein